MINTINNPDEICGVVKTNLEELNDNLLLILKNEKAEDDQNLEEDEIPRHYLPEGLFNEVFIPRYFMILLLLDKLLSEPDSKLVVWVSFLNF